MLKENLIKMNYKNPSLRDHLRPIIAHLEKQAERWVPISSKRRNYNASPPKIGTEVRISDYGELAHGKLKGQVGVIKDIVDSNVSHGYGDSRGWRLRVEWESGKTSIIGNWHLEQRA